MPIPDLIPNWKVAENTCILKGKHTVEIGSQINFLGVALWLKLSEAENQGIERFMQTLLKQRSSKLGADNEICECIIFKIFFSGKSDTGAETSTIAAEGIVRQWIFKQKTLCNVSMWEKKKKSGRKASTAFIQMPLLSQVNIFRKSHAHVDSNHCGSTK